MAKLAKTASGELGKEVPSTPKPGAKGNEAVINLVASGISGGLAAALTNPLEVLKVRWQVTPASMRGSSASMTSFASELVKTEGAWRALGAPGLSANAAAIGLSAVGRVGLYPSVRDAFVTARGGDVAKPTPGDMFACGLLSGAVGYFLATPLFAQKTILQAEAGLLDPATGLLTTGARKGSPPAAGGGWLKGVLEVAKTSGVAGLYKGSGPLVVRGATLSAGNQLGYDGLKKRAKAFGVSDGPTLQLAASVMGALGSTICACPADVVTTRYMSAAGTSEPFASPMACVRAVLAAEGVGGFYRGATPLFAKLAPLYLLSLPLHEQIRRMMGLGYT